ncbi:hypothetical protein VNI00_005057 [Paramarasmius palmivorus]|uniref:ABC transporter domain-containing protein n=1 Tax=Paramarasmius palmivorus TaxID=297713 RepID=A0AAW0DJ79_9AGAR
MQAGFPDFSKYLELRTLSDEEFPIGDESRRVILVGDVHGMNDQLQSLLRKVSYDPSTDIFVHVGDIIAKSTHSGSMAVLDFMATNNITGVRGNHDQKVIEWRAWLDWIHTIPGGAHWLARCREKWDAAQKQGEDDVDAWVEKEMKKDKTNKKWWKKIPDGWKLFGDHYEIAAAMTDKEFQYMVSRPLRLHVPSAHTFIVHAGVLSSDPERNTWDTRQPLATIPHVPRRSPTSIIRRLQEVAILHKVRQNLDPWVTLNMRGVTKKGKITRGQGGTPWAELYNEDMGMCSGFDNELNANGKHKKTTLPCRPATVVYGHAASRGLDVKRWTIGLDSGCVYERRLTALVLGGKYASTYTDADSYYNDGDTLDEDDSDSEVYDINGKRAFSLNQRFTVGWFESEICGKMPIHASGVAQTRFSTVRTPVLSRASSSSSTIISIPKADIYPFGATRDRPVFTDVEWTVKGNESWAVVGTGSGEKDVLFQTLLGHFRISPYPPSPGLFPFLGAKDPTTAISTVSFTHRPRTGANTDFYDYSARYGAVQEEDKITLRQSLYTSLGIAKDPFLDDPTPEEHRMSEEDKHQFHELAENMGLSAFLDLPVIALSNGQTRRARILKAVLRKPRVELLILDEPLTGLDVKMRPRLLSLLHGLHTSASPRILLGLRTHDDVPEWVTNVALVGGRRVVTGSRDEYLSGTLAEGKHELFGTGFGAGSTKATIQEKRVGEVIVDMKNVRLEYSSRKVLKDINWQIRQGERWHLQGENGSGKTSLLAVMIGDHPQSYTQSPNCYTSSKNAPRERHLKLFSHQRRSIPTPHLQSGSLIGVVSPEIFDAFPRRPGMTVWDVVGTGFDGGYVPRGTKGVGVGLGVGTEGKRYGVGEIREFIEGGEEERWRVQRMWEVLTSLGPGRWDPHSDLETAKTKTEEFSKRAFVSLSVGKQRMVLLMRALVARPKLVLLDEVWSGMDEGMVRAAKDYLRGDGSVGAPGVDDTQAVIVITHWEEEVPWVKSDGLKTFRLVGGEGHEVL